MLSPHFLEEAKALDAQDTLARFRERFYLPSNAIYFDGNSLGLLSKDSEAAVQKALAEWRDLAVLGWTQTQPAWMRLAETLSHKLAPLVGAEPDEVLVANSTTVNLHQLLSTLYNPRAERNQILTDSLIFPSTAYALKSHLALHGLDPAATLVVIEGSEKHTLEEGDIIAQMRGGVGMVLLSGVLYKSGQLLDMEHLTATAHERGILIGFDCAHSIGSVPHQFDTWGVDFAFWCHYKHINGGPGAVGGLYLNRRHFQRAPGLAGWFGSRPDRQFEMSLEFDHAVGASGLQIGTPAILSMAPLAGSLQIFEEAGIENIRRKSLGLSSYFRKITETFAAEFGLRCITPSEDNRRGGHATYEHPRAAQILDALGRVGIVIDFRPPNLIRFAPTALYNTFEECYRVANALETLLRSEAI